MLSQNTLLNKARYCIGLTLRTTPQWSIYAAQDLTASTEVLIIEHLTADLAIPSFKHDGLVVVAESFTMNGRHYAVTEPISTGPDRDEPGALWDRLATVLMALNTVIATDKTPIEVSPEIVVRTAEGRYKLLAIPAAPDARELEAWHVAPEVMWHDLDHISQKAIYNAWDEKSLNAVQGEPDEDSDIYSVAAIFYQKLTGTAPISGFERTVVELDGADPLIAPVDLAPELGSEASQFLVRCMSLRRDERFRSFEEAVMNIPAVEKTSATAESLAAVFEEDELDDLLEVLPTSRSAVHKAAPSREADRATVDRLDADLSPAVQAAHFESPQQLPKPAATKQRPNESREADVTTPGDAPVEPEKSPTSTLGFSSHPRETAPANDDALIFSAVETSRKGSRSGAIMAIAALILVTAAGFGIYQFSGTSSAAKTEPAVVPPSSASVSPASDAPHSPSTEDGPPVTPAAEPGTIVSTTQAQTRVKGVTTAKVQTPAKPAIAADQKNKKKVTVDDLINDN